MTLQIKLEGMEDLERRLSNLEPKELRKKLRATIRRAARPVVATSKRLAPRGRTGLLKKSIREIGSRTSSRTGELSIVVGTKGNKRLFNEYSKQNLSTITQGNQGAFYSRSSKKTGRRTVGALRYAHLVIGGTDPHDIPRGTRQIGPITLNIVTEHPGSEPNPFFDDAAEMKFRSVVTLFYDELRKQLA